MLKKKTPGLSSSRTWCADSAPESQTRATEATASAAELEPCGTPPHSPRPSHPWYQFLDNLAHMTAATGRARPNDKTTSFTNPATNARAAEATARDEGPSVPGFDSRWGPRALRFFPLADLAP